MESDTTIAVLGVLLLLAGIGLVFLVTELEQARSHQRYLREQVNKYRHEAHAVGGGEADLPVAAGPVERGL